MQPCNNWCCVEEEKTKEVKQVELELTGDQMAKALRDMYMYVTSHKLQANIHELTDRWRKVREFGYL